MNLRRDADAIVSFMGKDIREQGRLCTPGLSHFLFDKAVTIGNHQGL
jgi:hypothetical protein